MEWTHISSSDAFASVSEVSERTNAEKLENERYDRH